MDIREEIKALHDKLLTTCDGHTFAASKTALLLVRDYMIRKELEAATEPKGE